MSQKPNGSFRTFIFASTFALSACTALLLLSLNVNKFFMKNLINSMNFAMQELHYEMRENPCFTEKEKEIYRNLYLAEIYLQKAIEVIESI